MNKNDSKDDSLRRSISLRFFASVRETLGRSEETLMLPADTLTVGGVRALLAARGGLWLEAMADTRVLRTACNQVMCSPDTPLTDGCEVAFFPPVTGG